MPRPARAVRGTAHHLSDRAGQRAGCVSGLRLGADDFLTKDVSLPHLAARVAALFRRIDALRRPDNAAEIIRRGALTIDGEKMQTTWNGSPVTLSLTEFWIVHALARNPGHVKNRQQLMDAANVVLDDNTITSHIKRVRRKFQQSMPHSMPSKRFTEWAIAGSSEHPPAIVDCCAHHPGAAVGRLPDTPGNSRRHCATRRNNHCWRVPAPLPMRCPRSRSACSATRTIGGAFSAAQRRSLRLSIRAPAAAGRLSRRLGHHGGSHAPAHHAPAIGARAAGRRHRAISVSLSSRSTTAHFDPEPTMSTPSGIASIGSI